ncbi:DNA-binding MarR family transcriptional regulator [Dyadobacter jejuensis]|uniref:DNA-binding MarR family transcriptional regulator n=1 Tax=Dyadobacter jejuensis TaxID=1082580 RepID=A0A316B8Y1_9BACT|nr:MarR family transcriptional regulator [Dyadobacter jejuensis]PWJ58997.1 DNA-binding MarR family transcriptional regulator [Dyadobacter jejuensis]
MTSINDPLKLILNINAAQGVLQKKMDAALASHGITLTDFTIFLQLSLANEEKMRRVDLAEKVGLTASGITRVLSPLEKLGLVRREAHSRDARVSYVKLAPAGKRILNESIQSAQSSAAELLATYRSTKITELNKVLFRIGGENTIP